MRRTVDELKCDRCGSDIKGPYMKYTVHYHHPKTLDICNKCEPSFCFWLGSAGIEAGPIERVLEGRLWGQGIPSKAEVEIFKRVLSKIDSQEQKLLFGREIKPTKEEN